MSRKVVYVYRCDYAGCTVEQTGGVGDSIRTLRESGHWCLEHYPYARCENARCGAKLRPHNAPAIDWPGTVAKGSATRCSSCHKHLDLYGTERKPGDRWTNLPGEGLTFGW